MMIKPLGDKVVVKLIDIEENKTKSGIVLTNNAKDKNRFAEVIAVSEDKDTPTEVQVGDNVILPQYVGTEIKLDGEKYTIIGYEDILAKIE